MTMNKPIYLGMTILDITKMRMYEFWYDYIKPKNGDRAIAFITRGIEHLLHVEKHKKLRQ